MKIRTITSFHADLTEFDKEVNGALAEGWSIYDLIATGSQANGVKHIAFLMKEES